MLKGDRGGLHLSTTEASLAHAILALNETVLLMAPSRSRSSRAHAEERLRSELDSIVATAASDTVVTRANENQVADIAGISRRAAMASALTSDELSLGWLLDLRRSVSALRGLIAKQQLRSIDSAIDDLTPHLHHEQIVDSLARLEESLLSIRNATLLSPDQAHDTDLPPLVVPLDSLLKDGLQGLAGSQESRRRVLDLGGLDVTVHIRCQLDLAKHALQNVLHNALKFASNERPITLTSGVGSDGLAWLNVQSIGTPILRSELAEVLLPGCTGAHSYRGGRTGHGVGLSVVLALCEQLGWTFHEIDSHPLNLRRSDPASDLFRTNVRLSLGRALTV